LLTAFLAFCLVFGIYNAFIILGPRFFLQNNSFGLMGVLTLIKNLIITLFFLAIIAALFFEALARYKMFRNGIIFVLGALLALEILYILNLPYLGQLLDDFSNSILGPEKT